MVTNAKRCMLTVGLERVAVQLDGALDSPEKAGIVLEVCTIPGFQNLETARRGRRSEKVRKTS